MNAPILPRIGTFFILIGLGLLFLFVVSIVSRELHFEYLFLSAIALVIGRIFRRTAPKPEPTRFSGIRRVNQRFRQRHDDKQTKEDQK